MVFYLNLRNSLLLLANLKKPKATKTKQFAIEAFVLETSGQRPKTISVKIFDLKEEY